MRFSGWVRGCMTGDKRLDFGGDQNNDTDQGFFFKEFSLLQAWTIVRSLLITQEVFDEFLCVYAKEFVKKLLNSNFNGILPLSRDCNPDPTNVFSIPTFGIGESLIPGSHRDYRDSGIRDSSVSVLIPGIKKTRTGLQVLGYRFAIISTSCIWKINCFNCIFGNDCCNTINRIYEQETWSAVADKPRDAFVQIQWRGCPENMLLP